MSGREMRGVLIYGRCILLQVPSKAVSPTHTPTHHFTHPPAFGVRLALLSLCP